MRFLSLRYGADFRRSCLVLCTVTARIERSLWVSREVEEPAQWSVTGAHRHKSILFPSEYLSVRFASSKYLPTGPGHSLLVKTASESLSFGTSEPFPFEAFGAEIRSQTHCKYLSVYLDAKLTFKKHIEHVTKKLNKFCGIIYRIRDRFPQKVLISFHYAYAQSVITFGLINYGSTYKTNLEPIDKAQGRIFRAIFYRRQWDTLQDTYTKHKFFKCSMECS